MKIGSSRDWPRIALIAAVAACGAGCATTSSTTSESTDPWQRVAKAPGCKRFSPHRHADVSVQLQPEFQATLMEHLSQESLDDPWCWYQVSSGDLLLRAGRFCGLSKEAQFREDPSGWTLVRVEQVLGQCDTKR